jgi:thiamine biosynthesis lipoprotein
MTIAGDRVHVEPVMGTVVSFHIRDAGVPRGALDDAVAWLHTVDRRFSPFRSDSEISRIGDRTLGETDAHPDVRRMLALGDELAADSEDALDVRRWRADGRPDPTAIVKGWSIEAAVDRLAAFGVRDFAIVAGGDVAVHGRSGHPEPWRVGIRHPDRPDRVATVLAVTHGGVATSAAYERGAHIVDPRTGQTASGVRSMTVVGPSLTLADAYATAAYVMGLDGLRWVARHDGYDAIAITWQDTVVWTSGIEGLLAA